MPLVDTGWFVDRLADRRLSQRGLAKFMGIDPVSVHRLLQGKRPMRFDEAKQLAQLLGVTVDDVLRHAVIAAHPDLRDRPVSAGPPGAVTSAGSDQQSPP